MANESPRDVSTNPLYWEKRLAHEGMPAELPHNIAFTPKIERKYHLTKRELYYESGVQLTNAAIADQLDGSSYDARIVRHYGERVDWADTALENLPAPHELPEEIVARRALRMHLDLLVGTKQKPGLLSRLERGVIVMRYGLESPTGKNHDVATVSGVFDKRENQIRGIEKAALRKIRPAAMCKHGLRDFLIDPPAATERATKTHQHMTEHSIFAGLNVQVLVFDAADPRPYYTRLSEACDIAAETWLWTHGEQLRQFVIHDLASRHFLKKMGEQLIADSEKRADGLFSIDTLRARILAHRQQALISCIEHLQITRRRISERPLHPLSQVARAASLKVVDTQIAAILSLSQVFGGYILAFSEQGKQRKQSSIII